MQAKQAQRWDKLWIRFHTSLCFIISDYLLFKKKGFCIYNISISMNISGQYSECHSCDATCRTCFGPQALDCSSCFKGTNIHSSRLGQLKEKYCKFSFFFFLISVFVSGYFLDQDSSCVAQCPSGSFANSATQLCEDCSPNCEACVETSDKCISCSKGSYKLILYQGRCWSECPEYATRWFKDYIWEKASNLGVNICPLCILF